MDPSLAGHANADHASYNDPKYWDSRYYLHKQQLLEKNRPDAVLVHPESSSFLSHAETEELPDRFEFDWLCDYEDLRPLIFEILHPSSSESDGKQHAGSGTLSAEREIQCCHLSSPTSSSAKVVAASSAPPSHGAQFKFKEEEPEGFFASEEGESKAEDPADKGRQGSERSPPSSTLLSPLIDQLQACWFAPHAAPPFPALTVLDLGAGNSGLMQALCRDSSSPSSKGAVIGFALDYSPLAFSPAATGAVEVSARGEEQGGLEGTKVVSTCAATSAPLDASAPVEAIVADARFPLPFRPGSVDLVIDKGCVCLSSEG